MTTLAKSKINSQIITKLDKVVINVGVGRLSQAADFDNRLLPEFLRELSLITGQRPEVIRSQKAIAGFKLRLNQVVGLRITLRRRRALAFLEKLINIILPRTKDFQGLKPSAIDAHGILNIGVKDQFIFPEIIPENSKINFSLEITVVLKSKNRLGALAVFKELNLPYKPFKNKHG